LQVGGTVGHVIVVIMVSDDGGMTHESRNVEGVILGVREDF
jgi:hypothetical protein